MWNGHGLALLCKLPRASLMSTAHVAGMEGLSQESMDYMSSVHSKPSGYLFLLLRKRYASLNSVGHQQKHA